MRLVFVPPYIYAHRVYLDKGEHEIKLDRLREMFGQGNGGAIPRLDQRWIKGNDGPNPKLRNWRAIAGVSYGIYYGFRTADDAMLFYMTFSGSK